MVEGQVGEEGEERHVGKVNRLVAWVDDGMEGIIFRCQRVEKWVRH